MAKTKLTSRNAPKVFQKITELDNKTRKFVLDAFDKVLDELCSNDLFGTEAQCDPRGDQRD